MAYPDIRTVWDDTEHKRKLALWERARKGAAKALGKAAPGDPEPEEPPMLEPPPPDAYSNWTTIVDEVTARYGVKITDVRRRTGRERKVILCMQELCYRLARYGHRRGVRLSYGEVGRIVDRDHSTVIYNEAVHAKRIGDKQVRVLSRVVDDE